MIGGPLGCGLITSGQPEPDRCELDEGEVVHRKPVVSRRDSIPQFGDLNHKGLARRNASGRAPVGHVYGVEADFSQSAISAKIVENDPNRVLSRSEIPQGSEPEPRPQQCIMLS